LNFGSAPFFVSPARHVEAQDMSGDLKENKKRNKYKNSKKHKVEVINKMKAKTYQ
jgi:hypothetical protein